MAEQFSARGATRRAVLTTAAAASAVVAGFTRPALADHHESITQTARFNIGAGKEGEAAELIQKLVAAVEEKEPDVLVYIAHRPEGKPNEVLFFEVYRNAAAVENHGKQPHLGELRAAFGAGVFAPPVEIVKLERIAGVVR